MNKQLFEGIRKIYTALIPLILNGIYELTVIILLVKIYLEVSK